MVSSDARFVCWKQGRALILCNGSYATIEGGPELQCRREVSWAEVIRQGSRSVVLSSDPEALQKEVVASDRQQGSVSRHP
jgi:hypothetical protein